MFCKQLDYPFQVTTSYRPVKVCEWKQEVDLYVSGLFPNFQTFNVIFLRPLPISILCWTLYANCFELLLIEINPYRTEHLDCFCIIRGKFKIPEGETNHTSIADTNLYYIKNNNLPGYHTVTLPISMFLLKTQEHMLIGGCHSIERWHLQENEDKNKVQKNKIKYQLAI